MDDFKHSASKALKTTKKYNALYGRTVFTWALGLAYLGYLGYAIYYNVDQVPDFEFEWCDGIGFAIIITGLTILGIAISATNKHVVTDKMRASISNFGNATSNKLVANLWMRMCLYLALVAFILIFLIVDSLGDSKRLISVSGLIFFLLFMVVMSKHRRNIAWRQVAWGIGLQFTFALIVMRWKFGRDVINCVAYKVEVFLAYSEAGSIFLYDYLVAREPFVLAFLNNTEYSNITYMVAKEINESKAVPGIPLFSALSVLYFFAFFINIMTHMGVMNAITDSIGRSLEFTIGTTACESANAAANIFLGSALAPLTVQPYLPLLTMSELHTCIASGFATIAGNVFALFISFGIDASDLLAASLMSAPAALACSKLLYPETEVSKTSASTKKAPPEDPNKASGLIDAACRGASEAGVLIINITGIVIAIVSFVAFLNGLVSYFAGLIGHPEVNFEWIIGKLFIPLAWMMGIQWNECETVGRLIGIKLILSEYIAYRNLGILRRTGQLSPRSVAITTFALCGQANPANMGITLAVFNGLCPARRPDYAKLLIRAFVAGTTACFLTACFAGALISEEDYPNFPAGSEQISELLDRATCSSLDCPEMMSEFAY